MATQSEVFNADALYYHLLERHHDGCFYRGQIREYHLPPDLRIWPSGYRLLARGKTPLVVERGRGQRGSGTTFYYRTPFAANPDSKLDEPAYRELVRSQNKLALVQRVLRNLFGYPLAEAVFQQAGMTSDGVDVTTDLRIAFFFALFEWRGHRYHRKRGAERSVLYVWDGLEGISSYQQLNAFDFHTCPPLIHTEKLMRSFAAAPTGTACITSIGDFAAALKWNALMPASYVGGPRPFDLIRMQPDWLNQSRVVAQHAALLLPDLITRATITRDERLLSFVLEQHRALLDEPMARQHLRGMSDREVEERIIATLRQTDFALVEDLSQSPRCKAYRFTTDGADSLPWLATMEPSKVFPTPDLVHELLRGLPALYAGNPHGITPLVVFSDGRALDLDTWSEFLHGMEERFFR